ncbi:MAG: insulinase family protein [Bacteroidota bacterium]|nr:insulinase family protein [Bacteroidota bacterium]
MTLRKITTISLITILGVFFIINAKKQMTKLENNYQSVSNDPLNAQIYTLDNGLKVYLTVYKDAPRVQTNIAVRAGSKNDPADATGLAHYLEHMLFKGTDSYGTLDYNQEQPLLEKIEELYEEYRSIDMSDETNRELVWNQIDSFSSAAAKFAIPNEYDKMVSGIGAKGTNAYTSNEKTVYVNDIPSNQLEKWLKIESERFRNPVFRLFHTELETVYEEKNRSLDNDGRKLFSTLLASLFPTHEYGQQTTIGTIEHLKNPSLLEIRKYFNKYYVPNNMAICLSGDFDPDQVIGWIDKYFGSFESKSVPEFQVKEELPITEPVIKEVYGPENERLYIGFRFKGVHSNDISILKMVDMILSNSAAGLIDLNLNQEQKIMNGGCFPYILHDYSSHIFRGTPKQGQDLEEVKDLLLGQIEEIKNGNFPDWLLDAIISDLKLDKIKKYESNRSRSNEFVNAFILDIDWEKYQNELADLAKITKQDIIDFANQYYTNNYVVVYKRQGEDNSVMKVVKPKITPFDINREAQSEFLTSILHEEAPQIEPVFIDFTKDIKKSFIEDVPVIYKENTENERFQLNYILDMGTNHNQYLSLAVDYLKYLGTASMTPKQKEQEFYKLGCDLSVKSSSDQTQITLTGLNSNFENSVKLFENILSGAVADEDALQNLKSSILKKRKDAKLDKQKILFGAMLNYAKYGAHSPFTYQLSKDSVLGVSSKKLLDVIHSLTSYDHRILYYGPEDINQVCFKLKKLHVNNDNLKLLPDEQRYVENSMNKNQVFVVDYNMKQAEVVIMSKGDILNLEKTPIIRFHNEYFGGGMSSIIFQEIREARGLAYSVYSTYTTPKKPEDSHYQLSYIGTQADKLAEAMEGMMNLLREMTESKGNMEAAKEGVIQKIRTERITKSNILRQYEAAHKRGIDFDLREKVFNQVPDFTMEDLKEFHDSHINNDNYVYMVLGDKDALDLDILNNYGEVKHLTLDDIFGY